MGTYNVSQAPPPANLALLDAWVPAPHRDPVGGRDLYVFGFQELGNAANREAWSQALVRHLSPLKADVAGATAAAKERAKAAKGGSSVSAGPSSLTDAFGGKKGAAAEEGPAGGKDGAAEVATAAALSAAKLSAAETEGAYVLLEYTHMWEMVSARESRPLDTGCGLLDGAAGTPVECRVASRATLQQQQQQRRQ